MVRNRLLYIASPMHIFSFFFFNDTATTEIYTLSLHDALPISEKVRRAPGARHSDRRRRHRRGGHRRDRKSTRLNSSHSQISYAVFCLKKKKKSDNEPLITTFNTTGYIDHAAFLLTINTDTTIIPKHLFHVYLNIYNMYLHTHTMLYST